LGEKKYKGEDYRKNSRKISDDGIKSCIHFKSYKIDEPKRGEACLKKIKNVEYGSAKFLFQNPKWKTVSNLKMVARLQKDFFY